MKTWYQNWDGKPFRTPDDQFDAEYMVWYGPAGRAGDIATELEGGYDGWKISDYQSVVGLLDDFDEDFPILKTSVYVDPEELQDAYSDVTGKDFPDDEELAARIAASFGIEKLGYWGGDEEMVEDIP